VGKFWVNCESFIERKNNNKNIEREEKKAESNGVIKFFEVGPHYRNLRFKVKGVLRFVRSLLYK